MFAVVVAVFVWLRPPPDPPLHVGAAAPGFELPELQGRHLGLADLRGRVVFVNFWATWCPPCRDEAPALERFYRAMQSEGLEVVAISIDEEKDRGAVEAFQREFGLSFPILMDLDKRVYASYRATGVPETFLVDAEGRLVERFIGPRDWDEPRYARQIRRLLAGGGVPTGVSDAGG
jgi:peroxiredoxin